LLCDISGFSRLLFCRLPRMRQRNNLAKTTDLAAYHDRTDALKAEIASRRAMPRDVAEAEAAKSLFSPAGGGARAPLRGN
jgi:hypothetical protein